MSSPSRTAAWRLAKRRSSLLFNPNPWPLVGVSVVLLMSFLSLPQPHHGLAVDLPTSAYAVPHRQALREDAIRLAVTKDGTLYFRGNKVPPEQITPAIRQAVDEGAERKVYLQVDSRARYGRTEVVLDRVREAGIRDICLLVEKPYRPAL